LRIKEEETRLTLHEHDDDDYDDDGDDDENKLYHINISFDDLHLDICVY
jgi:hypothetical protein